MPSAFTIRPHLDVASFSSIIFYKYQNINVLNLLLCFVFEKLMLFCDVDSVHTRPPILTAAD